ncbi:hypothetical protein BGW39_007413 [Mortierella sp. 14UC]|nr:hypothetical protein BGW39_007413 [Mortierella sp. 14UC]
MATVATFSYADSGQTETLKQDSTLILGRNTFTGTTSPHIILLTSKGDNITITNLGTNRALLNGKQLSKETPANLKDGDVITLVEAKYQILVQLFTRDSVAAQDKSNASEKKASPTAAAGSSSKINTTSSPLRPPPLRSTPPHKKPKPSSTTTTGAAEKPEVDSPAAPIAPIAIASITAVAATSAVPSTSAIANPPRDQEQKSSPQPQQDICKMDIVDDQSESTSDSDKDKHMEVVSRSSDISDESSFVCEDLSDMDNVSDSDE